MAEDETNSETTERAEESGAATGAGEALPAPPPEVTVPPDSSGNGNGVSATTPPETTHVPETASTAGPEPDVPLPMVPESGDISQPEPATSVVADAVSDEVDDVPLASPPAETVSHQTDSHRLPNGMVGRPYSVSVDLREWGFKSTPTLRPSFAEHVGRLGLSATAEAFSLHLSGTPVVQGEHELLLHYKLGDDPRTFHRKISLLINPDPKSLWKELEPDTSLPFRKEHTAAQRLVAGDYQVVAASRRGRSHAHEGKFREDDFAVTATPEGWLILLVADGAGSAGFSREGSRLACGTAARSLRELVPQTLGACFDEQLREYAAGRSVEAEREIRKLLYQALCGAAFAAYKALEARAAEGGHALKDYATTLLVGLARRYEQGTFVGAFWIGDGAVALLDGGGSARLLGTPDGGEYSGQTRFLTMREVVADGAEMMSRVRFELAENFGALILMTDGVSDPKFGTDQNLASAEKWGEFWREVDGAVDFRRGDDGAPRRLLEWMDFWSPGEHDDRTLAVLC
jgi:serine/threonine protein phosphatase PrpC